jgi:hypothetical protein
LSFLELIRDAHTTVKLPSGKHKTSPLMHLCPTTGSCRRSFHNWSTDALSLTTRRVNNHCIW